MKIQFAKINYYSFSDTLTGTVNFQNNILTVMLKNLMTFRWYTERKTLKNMYFLILFFYKTVKNEANRKRSNQIEKVCVRVEMLF